MAASTECREKASSADVSRYVFEVLMLIQSTELNSW